MSAVPVPYESDKSDKSERSEHTGLTTVLLHDDAITFAAASSHTPNAIRANPLAGSTSSTRTRLELSSDAIEARPRADTSDELLATSAAAATSAVSVAAIPPAAPNAFDAHILPAAAIARAATATHPVTATVAPTAATNATNAIDATAITAQRPFLSLENRITLRCFSTQCSITASNLEKWLALLGRTPILQGILTHNGVQASIEQYYRLYPEERARNMPIFVMIGFGSNFLAFLASNYSLYRPNVYYINRKDATVLRTLWAARDGLFVFIGGMNVAVGICVKIQYYPKTSTELDKTLLPGPIALASIHFLWNSLSQPFKNKFWKLIAVSDFVLFQSILANFIRSIFNMNSAELELPEMTASGLALVGVAFKHGLFNYIRNWLDEQNDSIHHNGPIHNNDRMHNNGRMHNVRRNTAKLPYTILLHLAVLNGLKVMMDGYFINKPPLSDNEELYQDIAILSTAFIGFEIVWTAGLFGLIKIKNYFFQRYQGDDHSQAPLPLEENLADDVRGAEGVRTALTTEHTSTSMGARLAEVEAETEDSQRARNASDPSRRNAYVALTSTESGGTLFVSPLTGTDETGTIGSGRPGSPSNTRSPNGYFPSGTTSATAGIGAGAASNSANATANLNPPPSTEPPAGKETGAYNGGPNPAATRQTGTRNRSCWEGCTIS